jgi:hypothetical protein
MTNATTKLNNEIISHITGGRTVEDTVTFLVMTEEFATKSEARTMVTELLEANGISTKKISKSDGLKKWFLALENPLDTTSADIKKVCVELEMKGGSIQYYINSYKLAIELLKKVQSK